MRAYRQRTGVRSTREDLLALQRRRLVGTARHAATTSPLYRELYAEIELSNDLELRKLPVVTKQMLMGRFDEWVSDPRLHLREVQAHMENTQGDERYLGEYRCLASSGTTGHHGVFIYGRDEWRQLLAMVLRNSELVGLPPGAGRRVRVATVTAASPLHLTGRAGISLDLPGYPIRRLDAGTPLAELVGALNEHRPDYLTGYASLISLLAIEQLEGRLAISPRMVATGGEVRSVEMTANIRNAWGAEPFNQYATTEGLFGSDCEHHQGIHVFEDLCLIEVVDERGDPVPEGVVGARLLFTSLINRSQPIVRYEITDRVSLTTAPCPCGRPLARIISLEGRREELLRFEGADGQRIILHPYTLQSTMAALPELRQYKIVNDPTGLHVLVRVRDGSDPQEVSRRIELELRHKLQAAGVAAPRLNVTVVEEIPRQHGHAAKFTQIESRRTPHRSATADPPDARSRRKRQRPDSDVGASSARRGAARWVRLFAFSQAPQEVLDATVFASAHVERALCRSVECAAQLDWIDVFE